MIFLGYIFQLFSHKIVNDRLDNFCCFQLIKLEILSTGSQTMFPTESIQNPGFSQL